MIVYVVTSGVYSDYGIEAVFDNKEQAELYCATKEGHGDTKYIEEYDTTEYHFDSKKPLFKHWEGSIIEDGNVVHLTNLDAHMSFQKFSMIQEHKHYRTKLIRGHVTLDRNSTEEQAKKAILDRYAQWKFEREG